MHIRQRERSDISDVASVMIGAFADNELWEYRFPHRRTRTLTFRARHVYQQRLMLAHQRAVGFVCVTDETDNILATPSSPDADASASAATIPPGTIIGYANWVRWVPEGDTTDTVATALAARTKSLRWNVERLLLRAEAWYEKWVCPNDSMSAANKRVVMKLFNGWEPWAPVKAEKVPHWMLGALAVRPEAQGQGVGRRLLEWGMERAEEEAKQRVAEGKGVGKGKVIALIASPSGRWLYEKMGFRVIGTEEGGPSALRVPGCATEYGMIWDPEGAWTVKREGVGEVDEEGHKPWVLWQRETPDVGAADVDGEQTSQLVDEGVVEAV